MLGSLKAAIPGAGPYDVKAALDGLLEQTVAKYPELQGIVTPENLSQLGDTTRKRLRQLMVLVLLHNNQGDVVFHWTLCVAVFAVGMVGIYRIVSEQPGLDGYDRG